MSEQPEVIKLKRITIKTESGSRWFDDPHKLLTQYRCLAIILIEQLFEKLIRMTGYTMFNILRSTPYNEIFLR